MSLKILSVELCDSNFKWGMRTILMSHNVKYVQIKKWQLLLLRYLVIILRAIFVSLNFSRLKFYCYIKLDNVFIISLSLE